MNPQPDRRRHHHVLYVGYGLIAAVLVLLAVSVNGWIDRARLHRVTNGLDHRIAEFKVGQALAGKKLLEQAAEIHEQKDTLLQHRELIQSQAVAISRLARLRRQQARALTGLHNELAVRYADDAEVKQRLQQLETNNVTARDVISATPAPSAEPHP